MEILSSDSGERTPSECGSSETIFASFSHDLRENPGFGCELRFGSQCVSAISYWRGRLLLQHQWHRSRGNTWWECRRSHSPHAMISLNFLVGQDWFHALSPCTFAWLLLCQSIFSLGSWPSSLTETARNYGLSPGQDPRSVMLSPPCTMFSQLMNTNWARMDAAVVKQRWKEAMTLLKLSLEVAYFTMSIGGIFILEHPTGASSWRLPEMQALINPPWHFFGDISSMSLWATSSFERLSNTEKHKVFN